MIRSKFLLVGSGLLALFSAGAASAAIAPYTITGGFNQDVVASGSSQASSTTTSIDNGGFDFYDSTFTSTQSEGGAFPAGTMVTGKSGNRYTLAAAAASNDLLLGSGSTGTLTLSPVTGELSVYVLGLSTNGPTTFNYTLNFSNGATATGSITYADWYDPGHTNGELSGFGRISGGSYDTAHPNDFSVYDQEITVPSADQALTLDSITFTATTSGSNNVGSIFALSGNGELAVPEPSTWATMLGGFGLLGLALRFRRTLAA